MNRNTVVGILGVAALAGAVAITALSSSEAAVTQTRKLAEVTSLCIWERPDDQGGTVLHMRAAGVCEELDAEGVPVRRETCEADKPLDWFVTHGILTAAQQTGAKNVWANLKGQMGKAVPRKRLDGSEVIEDLR